jgi:hypothetical protein
MIWPASGRRECLRRPSVPSASFNGTTRTRHSWHTPGTGSGARPRAAACAFDVWTARTYRPSR